MLLAAWGQQEPTLMPRALDPSHPAAYLGTRRAERGASEPGRSAMAERSEPLRDVTAVLLDLDGTVFVGDRLVLGAAGAITELRRSGLPVRWQTGHGLVLDAGAFVAALEYATGREATIVGKPSPAFFRAAAESMGVDLPDMAVVGDDITTDVAGAQACGAAAVLVRTGKFREGDLSGGSPKPDVVLESLASLPRALGVDLS